MGTGAEPEAPTGRRAAYSAGTRRALLAVARDLFTEHGYAGTSLDAVVSGAEVTKGALYHHFTGKQALFEAVFEQVEAEAARAISDSLLERDDPWAMARSGLRTFLHVVQQPDYRRLVIQDGPAVLGYERYREQEERSAMTNIVEIVRAALAAGPWELDEALVQTFASIFYGAVSSAGESVASAAEPTAEAERVEVAIGFVIAGFQAQAEAGAPFATGLRPPTS